MDDGGEVDVAVNPHHVPRGPTFTRPSPATVTGSTV